MMQRGNQRSKLARMVHVSVLSVSTLWVAWGCVPEANDGTLGGETGFLEACGSDADCRSGFCACGVCTRTCEQPTDCNDQGATCLSEPTDRCAGESRSICGMGISEAGPDLSTPPPGDASSQPAVPTCEGFACESGLLSASTGNVTVEVEMQGLFCGRCGREQTPTLTHVASGLVVPLASTPVCNDECADRPQPTAECVQPTAAALDWSGEVTYADQTCESPSGAQQACQSRLRYAPPGRYRAELCTEVAIAHPATGVPTCPGLFGTSDLEPRCATIEFDYPTGDPVVLELVNMPVSLSDAGVDIDASSDGGARP